MEIKKKTNELVKSRCKSIILMFQTQVKKPETYLNVSPSAFFPEPI